MWGAPALIPCIQTSSLLAKQPCSPGLSPAPQRTSSFIMCFNRTQPFHPAWPYLCGGCRWGLGTVEQQESSLGRAPLQPQCSLPTSGQRVPLCGRKAHSSCSTPGLFLCMDRGNLWHQISSTFELLGLQIPNCNPETAAKLAKSCSVHGSHAS